MPPCSYCFEAHYCGYRCMAAYSRVHMLTCKKQRTKRPRAGSNVDEKSNATNTPAASLQHQLFPAERNQASRDAEASARAIERSAHFTNGAIERYHSQAKRNAKASSASTASARALTKKLRVHKDQ